MDNAQLFVLGKQWSIQELVVREPDSVVELVIVYFARCLRLDS